MKTKSDRLEKQLTDSTTENKTLLLQLEKVQLNVVDLSKQMAKYDRDKTILAVSIFYANNRILERIYGIFYFPL